MVNLDSVQPLVEKLREKIVGGCHKCNGEGFSEAKACECLITYEKKVKFVLSGFPVEFIEETFDRVEVKDDFAKRRIHKLTEELVSNLKDQQFFVIYGSPERLKLISCMANFLIDKGKEILYTTLIEILLALSKRTETLDLSEFLNVEYLFIDDLKRSVVETFSTPFVCELLKDTLKRRAFLAKKTILLSATFDDVSYFLDPSLEGFFDKSKGFYLVK